MRIRDKGNDCKLTKAFQQRGDEERMEKYKEEVIH